MGKLHHYCAFCRRPKYVYERSKVGLIGFSLLFVMSGLFSYGLRKQVDEFIFYIFFSLVVLVELGMKMRYRISLLCKECGFDPLIYKRSPERAVVMVQKKLEQRLSNPENLLRKPLELPQISQKRRDFWDQLAQKKPEIAKIPVEDQRGRILSRQI